MKSNTNTITIKKKEYNELKRKAKINETMSRIAKRLNEIKKYSKKHLKKAQKQYYAVESKILGDLAELLESKVNPALKRRSSHTSKKAKKL
ncbi:hypothetical protein HYX18_03580 [Candidatus Woesearchaeota archaeon]|nr:hypothetical protein [Candidatus Woesearchaeota archaeon]